MTATDTGSPHDWSGVLSGATPSDLAWALVQPERSHDEMTARLLERRLVRPDEPDELDEFFGG